MTHLQKLSRRRILTLLGGAVALAAAFGPARLVGRDKPAQPTAADPTRAQSDPGQVNWGELSEADWRARLDEEVYEVLREEATEPAFSSPLNAEKDPGTYTCAGCGLALFDSETKFESGTGWPSFFDHLPDAVATRRDFKLIFPRTEYHCSRCGGHQGHLFNDGPEPTGKRYCNNGLALRFVPAGTST